MFRPTLLIVLIAASITGCRPSDEAAPAATPAAQTGNAPGLDDISNFSLSMDKIDKLHQAQINIGLAVKKMTPAERDAIKNSSSNAPNATLDEMAANIEKHKPYDDAIKAAGLSAREYATVMLAMMQAAMARSVLQMRPNDNQDSLIREMKVNKANIEFMRINEAELARKQQTIVEEMKRLGIDEES